MVFLNALYPLRGTGRVEVGGSLLQQFPDPRLADVPVVLRDLSAAPELPLDAHLLGHEQESDAEHGLAGLGGGVLTAEAEQGVVEEFEELDLHLRAGEPVDDDPVPVPRVEQLLEQQADDLTVPDHMAGVL